jgi:hypothetical protein
VAAAALCGLGLPANALLITFDDISTGGGYVAVPNGYQGFNWSDIYAEGGLGDGYTSGVVSPPNAAFNGFGTPGSFSAVSGTFTFNSGYFTGAFGAENVNVPDNLGDSKTFSVNETTPTLETFNWTGITMITVAAVPDGEFTQVVFDNLTVNGSVVPEPATLALMLVGFGGVGALGALRASRRKTAFAA